MQQNTVEIDTGIKETDANKSTMLRVGIEYNDRIENDNSKAPFTRYNLLSYRLSNPLSNRFDNRLYRVNGVLQSPLANNQHSTSGSENVATYVLRIKRYTEYGFGDQQW